MPRPIDGRIVGTRLLEPVPEELAADGWVGALEHDRLPFISYPYEWSFSMLRDAALLHLDLVEAALDEGLITKDATPYNVQFDGARPVFIDLGSFEKIRRGEPWFGYRQYCELFLNPLLLQAKSGLDARQLLRGSLKGVSPSAAKGALPRGTRMRPSVFTQVSLHAWAERKYSDNDDDVKGDLAKAGFGPAIIRSQVKKLRKLTASTRWKQRESTWSEYSDRTHYDEPDLARKAEFCRAVAALRPRRLAVDFGANDGHFTRVVLPHCDRALAVDNDELVIDRLYQRLKAEGETRILPAVRRPRRLQRWSRLAGGPTGAVPRPAAARPRAVPRRDPPPGHLREHPAPADRRHARRPGWRGRARVPAAGRPEGGPAAPQQGRPGVPGLRPGVTGEGDREPVPVVTRELLPSGTRVLYPHLSPR